MHRTSSRVARLETTRQERIDSEALAGLRLCWNAEHRLTLAEFCDHGEGDETRLNELYEETGAVACERTLEARYGRRAVQTTCERIFARMEAEVFRKADTGEALTDDERLFSGEDGAYARFLRSCSDEEFERIDAVKDAVRIALVRTIATKKESYEYRDNRPGPGHGPR